MDFSELIQEVVAYFTENPYIAGALGLLFLFMLFKKPKLLFSVIVLVGLLAGVFYLISSVASTGVSQKERMLHKDEQVQKQDSR
jgi:hypothetical protein